MEYAGGETRATTHPTYPVRRISVEGGTTDIRIITTIVHGERRTLRLVARLATASGVFSVRSLHGAFVQATSMPAFADAAEVGWNQPILERGWAHEQRQRRRKGGSHDAEHEPAVRLRYGVLDVFPSLTVAAKPTPRRPARPAHARTVLVRSRLDGRKSHTTVKP